MDIVKQVLQTIKQHELIQKNDRILIGLSGGSDSVTLLHILYSLSEQYDLKIAAAHINHNLRPTAERDMKFCQKLCEKLNIECYCLNADIKNGAAKAGMSEETYAREVRYSFFSSLPFDKIATAHNKNDAAETILFHFIRGASLNGLSGIPYTRGNIIRPLLDVKKEDITNYCKNSGLEYVTDETNFEPIYTRNRLRLELIPEIELYNPAFTDVITANAAIISEDSLFLEKLAEEKYDGRILLGRFLKLDAPLKRRILQLHYKKAAGSAENLSQKYIKGIFSLIKSGISGHKIDLPQNFEAVIEYDELLIRKKTEKISFLYNIYPDVVLNIPEIGKNVIIRKSEKGNIYLENTDGLFVRNRKKGDFFYPVGMTGRKKLSDFFTDKKIPAAKRDTIPLLMQNDAIVSVIGLRNDRRFCDKAKTAYKIELLEADNAEKI